MPTNRTSNRRRPKGYPPPAVDRCEFCRKRIIWTVTRNNKLMPIDYDPTDDGNILLSSESDPSGRPLAGVLGPANAAGAREAGQQLRTHHRLSCPFVSSWARQR